ncbi:MAG: DUF1588 domain-containing protein, partial [Verrucomicrobiota bacterium]
LEAQYTFANKALLRHYTMPSEGIEFPSAGGFAKVPTKGFPRGGLLGQASLHTVTANGVDTSPIVRGVWLLENILGTPPSPPPPDVEPLDPDVRGAKTIREQMEKHRTDPTCAECHRRIDPLGFALEHYDAVGRFRNFYGPKRKIDMSGQLPGGIEFDSMPSFRQAMNDEHGKFERALTNKLMEFALGRSLEISDRPQIDEILAKVHQDQLGFRDLIKEIVLSSAFRKP